MARHLGKPATLAAVAALALAVLLVHLATLVWLAVQWPAPSRLQAFSPPLMTREIRPQPMALPAAVRPPARPKAPDAPPAAPRAADSAPATATPTVTEPPATDAVAVAAGAEPSSTTPTTVTALPTVDAVTATTSASVPPSSTTVSAETRNSNWAPDTRLHYQLGGYYRGDLHGSAEVLWQRQADNYQVRIDVGIGWLASVVMTSQGQIRHGGLHPQRYEEQVASVRRQLQLGEQTLQLNDGKTEARPPQVQDTASQFVELSHRFQSGEAVLAVGETVRFWLARPNGQNEWTYDVVDSEMLVTRLGTVRAFHLKPRPVANPRGSITAEMWFAPELQYLPVRIRMNINAETWLDLVVDRIDQR